VAVIIDANRCSDFGAKINVADVLAKRIGERKIKVSVCQKLLKEMHKTKIRSLLTQWESAGMLIRVQENLYQQEISQVQRAAIVSDDPHILALAIVSGCRLLYTNDNDLIRDFKDISIIRPKGKILKSSTKNVDKIIADHYD